MDGCACLPISYVVVVRAVVRTCSVKRSLLPIYACNTSAAFYACLACHGQLPCQQYGVRAIIRYLKQAVDNLIY